MDRQKARILEESVAKDHRNMAGMVVWKDGAPVYEDYWNGCTAHTPTHVFSVTKSVISILIGIAIDRGHIQSVDQRVLDFFSEYTVKRGEKTIQTITLRHLLTMTAPFKYRSAPYTKFFSSPDWVRASLDLLGGRKSAGEFRYMEMIGPDILSGILARATGQSVLDFAQEALFGPLGITVATPILLDTQEAHVAFIRGRPASGWVADDQGNHTAGWGLTLTAGDMAKLGQLYLNGGSWEGRRIVSAQWVRESTTEHSRWEAENLPYGYLWWVMDDGGFAALGNSGTTLYVNPEQKLVVAVAALFAPAVGDRIGWIKETVEPLFETDPG